MKACVACVDWKSRRFWRWLHAKSYHKACLAWCCNTLPSFSQWIISSTELYKSVVCFLRNETSWNYSQCWILFFLVKHYFMTESMHHFTYRAFLPFWHKDVFEKAYILCSISRIIYASKWCKRPSRMWLLGGRNNYLVNKPLYAQLQGKVKILQTETIMSEVSPNINS